jgi:Uma2 family endonuclease
MAGIILAQSLPPYLNLPPLDDLACDDNIPMETEQHKLQMDLLIYSLKPWLTQRPDGYVGGNRFVHFIDQAGHREFRGPDVFVALGIPKGIRKNWVVWQEGKEPDVVIELLSTSTFKEDKNEKKQVYQNQLRVKEYFWFDPLNPTDFADFSLQRGNYQRLPVDRDGRLISQQLGLALIRWQGSYEDLDTIWLRWETLDGVLLLAPQEIAKQQQQLARQAQAKAQQAEVKAQQAEVKAQQTLSTAAYQRQRAEQLANQLRAWGIDPVLIGKT